MVTELKAAQITRNMTFGAVLIGCNRGQRCMLCAAVPNGSCEDEGGA